MAKAFDKFVNKPVKGAKIKEAFRQEKKAAIKERREAIEKRFEEKRQQKQAQYETRQQPANSGRPPVSRNQSAPKSGGPRAKSGGSTTGKTWQKKENSQQKTDSREQTAEGRNQRPASTGWQKVAANRQQNDSENYRPQSRPSSGTPLQRPSGNRSEGYAKHAADKKPGTGNRSTSSQRPAYPPKPSRSPNPKIISDQSRNPSHGKPVIDNRGQKTEGSRQSSTGRAKPTDKRRENTDSREQKPAYKPKAIDNRKETTDNTKSVPRHIEPKVQKPFLPKSQEEALQQPVESKVLNNKTQEPFTIKDPSAVADSRFTKEDSQFTNDESPSTKPVSKRIPPAIKYASGAGKKTDAPGKKSSFTKKPSATAPAVMENMPLNKFLAHAGICSRRDAADKVRQGHAAVNGEVITEPAFKVSDKDVVTFDGQKVQRSRNQVYILLNKPKDTITTSDDPQGRHTVMDIIRPATEERVYPVGRLDRNTSGVLLLTNDGDLAQQLSHPSFEVRKIYEVKLDKPVTKDDFDKILNGITLEDGEIHADSLAYSDSKDRSVLGIEIHSGRNRIVRRMFEHLGYDVRGLDRVMYANLTKKNIERGHWRFLSEKEVRLLKYFNKSKKRES